YLNTDVTDLNQANGEWKIHLKNGMKELKEQVKNKDNPEELKALQNLLDKAETEDRKSTRLNSSHVSISYAVFCLKKKKIKKNQSNSGYSWTGTQLEVSSTLEDELM